MQDFSEVFKDCLVHHAGMYVLCRSLFSVPKEVDLGMDRSTQSSFPEPHHLHMYSPQVSVDKDQVKAARNLAKCERTAPSIGP